jgi:hypothetical protein
MQPVAADSSTLVNGIPGPRHYQHLPQIGAAFDIACLLQEIGANSAGRLAEKLRNIKDAKCLVPKWRRERAPGNV